MKKILLILAAGCTMALVSCEEWLDKYPLAQMSPETFFSNENELQAFSNKFYTAFPSDGLYNEYWDNIIHNDLPQEMRGGRTIPASGGGWTWTDLRDINTLLEYSVNCKDLDVRNHYDALARFFRAYFYFEKIKRFGDVPWYSKPIGSADPELKRPRDSREYVMQRMIEDIDFAILYLPTKHDLYRITKWTALALKSRFCLFEGTFAATTSKYYLSLSKASEEFITNSGYGLYTSDRPLSATNHGLPSDGLYNEYWDNIIPTTCLRRSIRAAAMDRPYQHAAEFVNRKDLDVRHMSGSRLFLFRKDQAVRRRAVVCETDRLGRC